MNAYTDLIQRIRLRAKVYHNAMVCGDWLLNEYHPGTCCFHMVTQGACLLKVKGLEVLLDSGDLVIFPREIAHQMCPTSPTTGVQQHLDYRSVATGGGTGLLCGAIYFDHPAASQLLDAMPVYFIIPASANQQWFKPLFDLIIAECYAPTAASSVILDRLSEFIFMQGLAFLMQEDQLQQNLLSLYVDARLSKAINAIHADPKHNWTLDSLAKIALVSRTQFAKLFREASGWTPMQYLTWWRMQIAVDLLKEGHSIGHICDQIGYQSEAAFQRMFKQVIGVTPGKSRQSAN